MYKISPKGGLCLQNLARQHTAVDDDANKNCDSDNIAELCRGHFSCRQLCLLLARFQISQNCIFFAKTGIAFFAKTFCQRMLAPANMQNFIDTIWNLLQSHAHRKPRGNFQRWTKLQCKVFPNQLASKCKFPPVEVLSAEDVAIPAIERSKLRENCVQNHEGI